MYVKPWVEVLTSRMEDPIPNGWKTTEIPQSEITRRLPAIMGFEIEIERLEGKFKLGQDEPKRDALAVADRLEPRDCDANSMNWFFLERKGGAFFLS